MDCQTNRTRPASVATHHQKRLKQDELPIRVHGDSGEFVDIQRAERIRYDVLRYSSDWKEDAQMLKAYMQTVFPKGYQSCS
jgi:hypothetical protein